MFKSILVKIFAVFFGVSHIVAPVSNIPERPAPVTKQVFTQTATTTKPISKPAKKLTPQKPAQKIATTTQTITNIPEPPPDFETINTFARLATVNILCVTNGNELSPISGTGVIVNQGGLILTNAHIAEYLLLKDFQQKDYVQCIARTGSPAYPKYHLELVYISPTWVANNKTVIKTQNPKGTGENDFAFLRITDLVDNSRLPDSFPFVPLDIRQTINRGEPVLLVSYPAGFLGGLSVLQNLNVTSAVTLVQDIFTFKENTIDLLAVPGTVISQKGSSGGLVVDRHATLIGIITTSSEENMTSDRRLNAITIAYINRSLESELGITLEQFLSQDLAEFAKDFQKTNVPGLTKLVTDELVKQ